MTDMENKINREDNIFGLENGLSVHRKYIWRELCTGLFENGLSVLQGWQSPRFY